MSSFSGGGKVQMERIVAFVEAVQQGRFPNARSMAEELEVSPKTIQRDIAFIRDRLHFPLEYDETQYGYYFTAEAQGLEEFAVQVEDLAALFLAKQTMGKLKGTKLAKVMQPSFDKIHRLVEGKVNLSSTDMKEVFSVRTSGRVVEDLELFGRLAEAVLRQREASFLYQSVGQEKPIRRRVQPYHVGEVNGGWYMIGLDVAKQAKRTYAFQRMKQLRVLKSRFERPEGLNCSFSGGIGVWTSDQTYTVQLKVTGWVFPLVQERVWHHSQEVEVLDSKRHLALVTMQVSALEELVSLVLSWGRNVKIISPKKLVQLVRSEVKNMQH